MKRLSGGLVLLNLTAISLALTSGEVNITDAGILEELTELRQFIDVNRDFSKGFKNLKPIMIEYRSSASKFNGITQANLSFNTDALHMSIGANTIQADGKLLVITINVVYEYTDYVGYTIKSAKLNAYETLADGDATFTGDVGIGGDLEITGDLVVTGKINNESDPSIKPIYCHPIHITGSNFEILLLIFDNNSSSYTKSTFWTKFLNLVVDNHAFIAVDGFYKDDEDVYYTADMLWNYQTSQLMIVHSSTRSDSVNFATLYNDESTVVVDGVNKLN